MNETENIPMPGSEIKTEQFPNQTPEHLPQNMSLSLTSFVVVKEKISDYFKHQRLEEKYQSGQISKEEFDQLLSFDFKQQLKDNPPIKGVFSPKEELEKLKNLPKEQKKEAISIFKEKLIGQRKALATMRVFMEQSIEFDNDTPKENLIELIDKFETQYGFDHQQRELSEHLINRYYENRQKVLAIRQQFPDNHELIKRLTDVNLGKKTKVGISVGPMTIDIWINKSNDFAKLWERSDNPKNQYYNYGGFASESSDPEHIYFIVINRNLWNRLSDDPTGKGVQKHEYEHQKNKLFKELFEVEKPLLPKITNNNGIRLPHTEHLFDRRKIIALENVKDEITAYLSGITILNMKNQLNSLFFNQKDNDYDYLSDVRKWVKLRNDPTSQELAQKILIQEYKTTIKKAVNSYAKLIRKGKYSNQEATALLTDKSLDNWPQTVKRILEQKNNNSKGKK